MLRRFLPLLLIFGLIAAPDAAFSSASDAALLWWTRVLPSLLPYLIAASLLLRSDLLVAAPKRLRPLLLLLLGALGGYPVGAKLAGKLYERGALSIGDAKKACAYANLPNPVFLISVVAAAFFGDPRAAAPLLIAVYAVALFGLIPLYGLSFHADPVSGQSRASDLPEAIKDGVRSVLTILGCLVFASVLGALLSSLGLFRAVAALFGAPETTVGAVSAGLFEMTCGMREIACAPLPLSVRIALSAFFLQIGGAAVLLQTASEIPIRFARYLPVKLVYALLSASIAFVLTPLFCPDAAVQALASRWVMADNAVDLASVLLSSAFGLLLVFVFSAGLHIQKRTP